MSKHASPGIIGAFVLAAVALVIAGVFILGGGAFFHKKARAIVYFDGSVAGLRVGAPVKFRGIEIGSVEQIRINMSGAVRDPRHVHIPVLIDVDLDRVKEEGVEEVHLGDPKVLALLVKEGLRAQLESESLVTGVLYVALDIMPDTPMRLVGDTHYPEIPSVATFRQELPTKIQAILAKLADLDLDKLVDSVQSTVDNANTLVASPSLGRAITRLDTITQRADRLLANLDAASQHLTPMFNDLGQTAVSARKVIMPAGVMATQLDATLREIESAARSLRRLADHLDRDPGSILRGGK